MATGRGLSGLVDGSGGDRGAGLGADLKMVAHSDLKVLDPVWTSAFITRNHGYMIYDTLFARMQTCASSRRWSTNTRPRPTS